MYQHKSLRVDNAPNSIVIKLAGKKNSDTQVYTNWVELRSWKPKPSIGTCGFLQLLPRCFSEDDNVTHAQKNEILRNADIKDALVYNQRSREWRWLAFEPFRLRI